MQEYSIKEVKELHVFGRTTQERNPLTLFWTASGMECNVMAKELWVEVEADYELYEPWISFVLDGAQIGRQMLQKGRYWIPVFRNLDASIMRNIRIYRDIQAMSGDHLCLLQIHALRIDGQFCPLPEKSCRIEFIGDSITSGEGCVGAQKEMDWGSLVFSSVQNYATLTANALHADYHVISQSGWGVLSSWDGNPACNLPDYYEQICGLLPANGTRYQELGAYEKNPFTLWEPDIIVINLGTNDVCSFSQPSAYYDKNGNLFDQIQNADGTYQQASVARLQQAIIRFLKQVRRCNSNAYIVWAYGMLGNALSDDFAQAVCKYQAETSDSNVSYLELDSATPDTYGSREHPGIQCHKQAAEKLISFIKSRLAPESC